MNNRKEKNPGVGDQELTTPVQYLKNVGPQRALLLQKMGLKNVGELLEYFPKRYEDRRSVKCISSLEPNQTETIRGFIGALKEFKPRRNLSITKAWIADGTGSIPAVWFNQPFVKKQLEQGREIMVHGKVDGKYQALELTVQDYEIIGKEDAATGPRILPVYGTTETLPQKIFRKIMSGCVQQYAPRVSENLPGDLLVRHQLMRKAAALQAIHLPESWEEMKAARHRLAFEELLLLQLAILASRHREEKGISHDKDKEIFTSFQKAVPFPFTEAQKRVIGEVFRDMERNKPMARLIQGDVGSGKTVVAAAALYKAVRSGFQGAMMVPTEILARQHGQSLSALFGKLGVEVACLTGSTPGKEREALCEGARTGQIQILVGTHALIQENVRFKNLSLAITDEQHRFGVMQRGKLQKKGVQPDILVMTATPIPRSLALTLYGDLALSVIDTLPPGRKEIKTYAVKYDLEQRIFSFIRKELDQGRQAYMVCPLVEESEQVDLQAAGELFERLARGEFKNYALALLHGKMKSREKDQVMEGFRQGRIQLLISTTVIEVGIHVPNATVMVIRDAERFGLAQLHQLRGRVGRGEHQSYCILMHHGKTVESRKRMEIMESTNDGFAIAEADLKLRGPGDFFGTRQHGLPELKIANIFEDLSLLETVREEAHGLLARDPGLATSPHSLLGSMVQEKFKIFT
ncbi:ATP-dependent DNA helicase RecG [Candidatus Formimonas warabiya]|uniref:ATP-dependent DNA helicase RecG n=1 Tax=Formimonas warabiya TaxID=1761012 RepID=UPI0011D07AF3|nr:ATP-dependent DNA helicase RecG [Candidatus Formimonas warabiya]